MKQVIKIRCKNNKKKLTIPIGCTLYDIYKKLNLQIPFGPISARVNNCITKHNKRKSI